MEERLARVALVTTSDHGGVWSVTRFLYEVLAASGRYSPDVITVAASWRDDASLRLLAPWTWFGGPKVIERRLGEFETRHVGAWFVELEVQRTRPRRRLTRILNEYDLVQIVGGTPMWVPLARDVAGPVCSFVASTSARERVALLASFGPARRLWSRVMMPLIVRQERHALDIAECIFAESEYSRVAVEELGQCHYIRVTPPGVDTDRYYPLEYGRQGYLLCVGRLYDPRKNLTQLFRAYGQLRLAIPACPKLLLVGHGDLSQEDRCRIKELWLESAVEIRKDVRDEELPDIYRGASVVLLPSWEEGLGLSLLEAMACGIPVVSTDCGGPATAITDGVNGFLTPVGDPEAFAQAVAKLLVNADLRGAMGRAARESAVDRFSLSAAGAAYLEVYDQLLAGARHGEGVRECRQRRQLV